MQIYFCIELALFPDDDDFRKKSLNALLLFEEKLFLGEFCMCELINYIFLTRTSHILKKLETSSSSILSVKNYQHAIKLYDYFSSNHVDLM